MSHIRGKNTKPEMKVRKLVHSLGLRYRLHEAGLPGRPDLVFKTHRKIIFINGCFWHRHDCKNGKSMPTSNVEYWKYKFESTIKRDSNNISQLDRQGWRILTIWECEISDTTTLASRVETFLKCKQFDQG
jgi:DNA mismatch endonuclease (patch repair protein)